MQFPDSGQGQANAFYAVNPQQYNTPAVNPQQYNTPERVRMQTQSSSWRQQQVNGEIRPQNQSMSAGGPQPQHPNQFQFQQNWSLPSRKHLAPSQTYNQMWGAQRWGNGSQGQRQQPSMVCPPQQPAVVCQQRQPSVVGQRQPGVVCQQRQPCVGGQQPVICQQPLMIRPQQPGVYIRGNAMVPAGGSFFPYQQIPTGQSFRPQNRPGMPLIRSTWGTSSQGQPQGQRVSPRVGENKRGQPQMQQVSPRVGENKPVINNDWMRQEQLNLDPSLPKLEIEGTHSITIDPRAKGLKLQVSTVSTTIPGDVTVLRGTSIFLNSSMNLGEFYDLLHTHKWYEPEAITEHGQIQEFLKIAPTEFYKLYHEFECFYKGTGKVYPLRLYD